MMDDRALAEIVRDRVQDSLGYFGDDLSSQRIQALQYYRGEEFGDEVKGRSRMVSRDVAETIDSLIPSLLKPFVSGDRVVQFEPRGVEDEAAAEQATAYCNWIFSTQNDGFGIQHTVMKDGLLQKTGVVKVWWDDTPEVTHEEYQPLTEEQAALLMEDEDIEVEEGEEGYTVTKTDKTGRCRIAPLAPEEFLIERSAVSLDDALFTAHRMRRTVSEMKTEYPNKAKEIEAAAGLGDATDLTTERTHRFADEDPMPSYQGDGDFHDPSTRYLWVVEAYMRVDYDEDGHAEMRKVTTVGDSQFEILDNELVDDHPFATFTPIPMSHKFYGMSVADQIMDLQLLKSTVWRQTLNNLYLANEPMTQVVEGQVNLDDLLNRRVGSFVRTTKLDSMREIAIPFVANHSFPMLEYVDMEKEQRTGVTRYSQGLDADALNKTARGIQMIQDAGKERQELIARVYAEGFLKRVFRLVLKNVSMYQRIPRQIRLRGEFVTMDPRTWRNAYDMTITVGLGTGNKDQQAMHAMTVLQMYQQVIAMQGGLSGPFLFPKHVHAVFRKLFEAIGWKSIDPYMNDPGDAVPQQQPQQDPKALEVMAKAQLQQKQAQMDHEFRMQKLLAETDVDKLQAQLQAEIDAWKAQHAAGIKEQDMNLRETLLKVKADNEADVAEMKVMNEIEIARAKAEKDGEIAEMKAQSGEGRNKQVIQLGDKPMESVVEGFSEIAKSMAEMAQKIGESIEAQNRPKKVTLTHDKTGRPTGGEVVPING